MECSHELFGRFQASSFLVPLLLDLAKWLGKRGEGWEAIGSLSATFGALFGIERLSFMGGI